MCCLSRKIPTLLLSFSHRSPWRASTLRDRLSGNLVVLQEMPLGSCASTWDRSPLAPHRTQTGTDFIERFDPNNPTLVSIHHEDAHAFLLTSVPEDEASDFMCQRRASATSKGPANSSRGPYFGTFFKIIEPGEEPAGLGFLWAKESTDWKIVAFQMDEP